MAPLQVIILLMIIRLPALLWAQHHPTPAELALPQVPPTQHAWLIISSFLFANALLATWIYTSATRAVRLIHQPTTTAVGITSRLDRTISIARWLTLANTAIHLLALGSGGLGAWLIYSLNQTTVFKNIPLLSETLIFLPVALVWMIFWTANYLVENATRQRAFAARIAMGLPAHEMPPLSKYLSMQARHNFYLVIPIAAASAIEDISYRLEPFVPNIGAIAVPVTVGIIFLLVPWIITRVWSTAPLKGPLRTRLDAIAAQYHLRFRNILIWKTHNAVTNAAILGFVPFARYFLMTDALLETLTDEQIEAVFAHEVGHGKHRHLHWYLVSMAAATVLSYGVADFAVNHFPPAWMETIGGKDATAILISLLALAIALAFGFPRISYQFEHQADWFAAQHMARSKAEHPAHIPLPASALVTPSEETDSLDSRPPLTLDQFMAPDPPTALQPADPRPPDQIGAEIFSSALTTLLDLTHRSRDRRDWMHPSANERITLIHQLAADPRAAAAFARQMFFTRLCLAIFIGGAAISALIAIIHAAKTT